MVKKKKKVFWGRGSFKQINKKMCYKTTEYIHLSKKIVILLKKNSFFCMLSEESIFWVVCPENTPSSNESQKYYSSGSANKSIEQPVLSAYHHSSMYQSLINSFFLSTWTSFHF